MRKFFPKKIDDIPMGQDISARYVCWIVGLMVYLLSLVFMLSMSLSFTLDQWRLGGVSRLTLEIPLQGIQNAPQVIDQVVNTMRAVPEVTSVTIVDSKKVLALLKPWIGNVDRLQDVALPALIDVDLKPNVRIDIAAFTTYLRQYSAGIRIEEHGQWERMFETVRLALQLASYLLLFLIAATIVATITLVTKSALAMHASIIDVLRLIGANSRYIANKFQYRAFMLALKGGIWGTAFAAPSLFFLNRLSAYAGLPEILKSPFDFTSLSILLLIPLSMAFLSLVVARFSVMRTLAKLG